MNYHASAGIGQALPAKTKIYSVGTFLPDEVVLSDHLFDEIASEQQYGIRSDMMSRQMGIIERRLSPAGVQPSSLAIPAAQQAIDNLPTLNPDYIDLVIFCGIERDQPEPATAHTIQDALKLKADHVFDLANACFGFYDAIEIATKFIASGSVRYALVTTGEVPSRVLRSFVRQLKAGVTIDKAHNMIGGLSVGDAGGAVILGPGDDVSSGFEVFNCRSNSAHTDKCIYRIRDDGEIDGQMLMAKVLAQGLRIHRELAQETLQQVGWDYYDWIISHQTGSKSHDFIANLGVVDRDRITKTYDYLGNITSATFPVNYQVLLNSGKLKSGSRIGGWFAGSGVTAGQFCYSS